MTVIEYLDAWLFVLAVVRIREISSLQVESGFVGEWRAPGENVELQGLTCKWSEQ
jgi:hypothetical protein